MTQVTLKQTDLYNIVDTNAVMIYRILSYCSLCYDY